MKDAITPAKAPPRTSKEKRAAAARTAAWRERKSVIEVRDVDKTVCEALAIHARALPASEHRALLAEIISLATTGLAYQGHDRAVARGRIVDRLEHWVQNGITNGTVRAVVDRERILSTSRATT